MHHRHYHSPWKRGAYSMGLIVFLMTLGTIGMHRIEGMPYIDAFYFTSMVATAQLAIQEKLQMVHIPYKGDGPLSIDLLGGRVQFAIATPGTMAPQVKEGKMRVLATLLPSRSPLLPDAPTMAESGLPPLAITPWGGIFGPAKMPREIAGRLSRELIALLKRTEVREAFQKLAFEPRGSTPEELAIFVKEQGEVWRRIVREIGIQPE